MRNAANQLSIWHAAGESTFVDVSSSSVKISIISVHFLIFSFCKRLDFVDLIGIFSCTHVLVKTKQNKKASIQPHTSSWKISKLKIKKERGKEVRLIWFKTHLLIVNSVHCIYILFIFIPPLFTMWAFAINCCPMSIRLLAVHLPSVNVFRSVHSSSETARS